MANEKIPAQATTETGKATEEKIEQSTQQQTQQQTQQTEQQTKTALQYHEETEAAAEAYMNEADPVKKVELKKVAQDLLKKTKDSYAAEKTAAEKTAAEKALADSKPKPPEKYDLKLPEGSPLTQVNLDKISAIAKEKGLSNEQAQEMVERDSQLISEERQNQKAEFVKINEGWLSELKNDKEIGGDKLVENNEKAARVLDRFGTPAFKKDLLDSGMGRHPGLFRFLLKVGNSMAEDKLIIPESQLGDKQQNTADKFYPTTAAKT